MCTGCAATGKGYAGSVPPIPNQLDHEQDRGKEMEKKVKDVEGFSQGSLLQHDELFKDVRHRREGRQEHEYRGNDQNGIG